MIAPEATTPIPETSHPYKMRGGESWRSPWADYKNLRDNHRVLRENHPAYGEYFVLSHFEDVFAAARDTETFSSAQGLTLDRDSMTMFAGKAAPIVMLDPPEHTAIRRLVSAPMTPRRVAMFSDGIKDFVQARLNEIGEGEIDIVEALFKPFPSYLVAHYIGVEASDRKNFDRWTEAIVAANAKGDIGSAPEAAVQLFGYATELIEHKRKHPGEDLVSLLVEAGDDRVSAEWIVGFVFTMVAGGNDTTTGLLGGTAELLTAYRDQRQELIDDPSLLDAAAEEFLRLTTPVQNLARTTTRDVVIGGVQVPRDRKVMLLYGAANRDDRRFGADADDLNIRRNPGAILTFGYGAHHCLGAAVARSAAKIAISELLAKFPDFEVDAARGRFAPGMFVRRYESLPFVAA